MNQLKTKAIVISRINYGEADRILTVLTPDYGKVRLMARGVRLLKSKLAGGIELFSVNDISFIRGKGDVSTLTSSRLNKNFGNILADIERVQFGYEILKTIHKMTEDEAEADYFYLLEATLDGLNDKRIGLGLIQLWFVARLLQISGHGPNLSRDLSGQPFDESENYGFDNDSMTFFKQPRAKYSPNDIKYLRLAFGVKEPQLMAKIAGADDYATKLLPLVNTMRLSHLAR